MALDKRKVPQESDLIRIPEQSRSRKTMDRILAAMEALLDEKSFDQITIQEIGIRSTTGASSIYARFKDKQSLVLGLHARLSEQVVECLDQMTDPIARENESTDKIIASIVPECVRFYRKHAGLIRAALRVDLPVMRERQASAMSHASDKFSALLVPRYPGREKEVKAAVQSSVKVLVSLMYTSLIFEDMSTGKSSFSSDRANIRLLKQVIEALIEPSST